jgi:hypothetical protein
MNVPGGELDKDIVGAIKYGRKYCRQQPVHSYNFLKCWRKNTFLVRLKKLMIS